MNRGPCPRSIACGGVEGDVADGLKVPTVVLIVRTNSSSVGEDGPDAVANWRGAVVRIGEGRRGLRNSGGPIFVHFF